MKKLFIMSMSFVSLITLMFMSGNLTATPSYNVESNNIEDNETINEENNRKVEELISKNNIDVVSELNGQIEYYQNLKKQTTDSEEIEKIDDLIETTSSLISEYAPSKYREEKMLFVPFVGVILPNTNKMNIAAVLAFFNLKGYVLAAELLTHASSNTDLDSNYYPVNTSSVFSSSVYNSIKNGSTLSGTSAFPNEGSKGDQDLYYAIHGFHYSKSQSGRVVVIQDRYDYESDGSYSSFGGIAVDLMYTAQRAGDLVPFYSIITNNHDDSSAINPTESLNIYSNSRYTEKVVTLGKGEYEYLDINFATSTTKVIQTFGPNDAYLELYDANGNFITSNDDGGYYRNAFISYYFYANRQYRLKVRFYSSSMSGEIKVAISPSTGAVKTNLSLTSYDNIYETSSTNFTFNTYAIINYSRLFVYKPTSKTTYTIETESSLDTYIYLIDPRSSREVDRNLDHCSVYNDDGGTNLNAKITKQLASNIPYLIVYSTYNITTQSGDLKLRIYK